MMRLVIESPWTHHGSLSGWAARCFAGAPSAGPRLCFAGAGAVGAGAGRDGDLRVLDRSETATISAVKTMKKRWNWLKLASSLAVHPEKDSLRPLHCVQFRIVFGCFSYGALFWVGHWKRLLIGGQLPKEIGIDPDTAEGDTNDDNADPSDPWAWTCWAASQRIVFAATIFLLTNIILHFILYRVISRNTILY